MGIQHLNDCVIWTGEDLPLKNSQGKQTKVDDIVKALRLKIEQSGSNKKISNNIMGLKTNKKMCYSSDTLGGNSGSPVFCSTTVNGKKQQRVVAIHNGGLGQGLNPPNQKRKFLRTNYGHLISDITDRLGEAVTVTTKQNKSPFTNHHTDINEPSILVLLILLLLVSISVIFGIIFGV